MKHMPLIASVMTPFPYSVEAERSLRYARKMMAEHKVQHLPVMENGQLIGVVSEKDIRSVLEDSPELRDDDDSRVRDIADPNAYVVALNTPLDQVLQHMAESHASAALVTKQGRLVGIFTMTDVCRSYGKFLRSKFSPNNGNDAA